MAIHTQLPIYKDAYTLFDVTADLIKNMNRDYKPTLGNKLRDECIEIMTLVFRANVADNKVPHIVDLLEHQQVIELLLRLCSDKRLISKGQYARAIELTTSIGKQANGWKRSAHRPHHGGQGRHD